VAGLDEFTIGLWPADNGTVQLAVAPLAADRRFRPVRDPAVFTAVLRTVPVFAAWLDVLEPITGVFPMAGLHNTLRRLVDVSSPVVTGLHAVGDSVCTTNPTLGRGLTLALSGAADLAGVIADHPADPEAQALALDGLVGAHVAVYYTDQAAIDQARLAGLRHAIYGTQVPPPPAPGAGPDRRVSFAELRAAAAVDPVAFRGFWNVMGMLCPPDEVYTDPQVVACTRAAIRVHGTSSPVAQPDRATLLAALTG
jgi:hypothetical protein